MMRFMLLMGILGLAGCAAAPPAKPLPPPAAPPPAGLAQILGRSEAEVVALLGPASMARSEGPGRQLQFIRPPCVFDVFLYPVSGVARVRTAVARKPDGTRMEPGACLTLIVPARP